MGRGIIYTKEQIAKTIDHEVLKPFATDEDVIKNAKICDERAGFSVCVFALPT